MNVSCRWIPAIVLLTAVSIASATSALAQATVVNGTGNPNVDIPAVQAAVNLGGNVVLRGHFSFNTPPTISTCTANGRVSASHNPDLQSSLDLRCTS